MLRLSVAKYMVHVMRYSVIKAPCLCISTFRIMCAMPCKAGCCASLNLCFQGVLLGYFLHEFETVAVALITTAITCIFTFHIRTLCFYFKVSFLFLLLLLFLQILILPNHPGNVLLQSSRYFLSILACWYKYCVLQVCACVCVCVCACVCILLFQLSKFRLPVSGLRNSMLVDVTIQPKQENSVFRSELLISLSASFTIMCISISHLLLNGLCTIASLSQH